ncbi:LytTR family DNA-binding domain-containing protein [Pedobacter gandavensis]|uniref:LytR/AlgR family response regulator transcription factor n=1 Tax=Pedobacter gandavensis TaxID=2679963 RepID=UPI00293039E1|nr:LytTR family DNA-binding domain-containing protein [Pedobacter gandavensis]
MKIRCLVVDDKPLAIDLLLEYISKIPFLELIASTTDPVEGLELLRTQQIDLIFLDIQMPQLSGLQFMKIAGDKTRVILTTAYAQYALDGYEHDAVDYLLKPIAFDRFYLAAEKAKRSLQANLAGLAVNEIPSDHSPSEKSNTWLFVKTEHRIQKINLAEVLYIEGLENYACIQTSTERILTLQTLKRLGEQLPPKEFVRVHRSFLISMQHISYVERSSIFLINGFQIAIGNSYRNNFYQILENK